MAELLANLRARSESVHLTSVVETLADSLPNRSYSVDGGEPLFVSTAAVRGTVVDAQPGAAYYVPGDELSPDAESGTEIDFYDERALWRQITVTLEVADGVGADVGETLTFAITSSVPDAEKSLQGAGALGEIAVVLQPAGLLKYDRTVHSLAYTGSALALVAPDGGLTYPAISDDEARSVIGDLTTWAALEDEASTKRAATKVNSRFERE